MIEPFVVAGSPTSKADEENSYDYNEEEDDAGAPGESRWDLDRMLIFFFGQNPEISQTFSNQGRGHASGAGGVAKPQICDGGAECSC